MVIVPSRCSHTVLKRQLVLLTYTVLMVPNIYFRFLISSTKKDSTKSVCTAFDDFIDYQREKNVPPNAFLIKFNLKCHKKENADMKLPTGVLAGFLLRCCNLSSEKEELVSVTCPDFTYEKMKETIEVGVDSRSSTLHQDNGLMKFSIGDSAIQFSSKIPNMSKLHAKQEQTFMADADFISEEEVHRRRIETNIHGIPFQRGRLLVVLKGLDHPLILTKVFESHVSIHQMLQDQGCQWAAGITNQSSTWFRNVLSVQSI